MYTLLHAIIAQEGGQAPAPGGADILPTFGLIAVLFVIFYFLLIRPQQKEAKRHRALLSELKKGDEVLTSGGLIGRIHSLDEKEVVLDVGVGDRSRIRVLKGSVQRRWKESTDAPEDKAKKG